MLWETHLTVPICWLHVYTLHHPFEGQADPGDRQEHSVTDDTYAIIFDLGEILSLFVLVWFCFWKRYILRIVIYQAHFNWMCAVWYSGRHTGLEVKGPVFKSRCPHFLAEWPWDISDVIIHFNKMETVVSRTQNCGPLNPFIMLLQRSIYCLLLYWRLHHA